MDLKTKILRKALSSLVSIVIIVSTIGFNLSFSTFATEQQEIDFCVDRVKNIPTDHEFLEKMRKLPNEEDLNRSRHEDIVHSDGSESSVDLDEKEVFKEIKKTVDDLTGNIELKESARSLLNFANQQDKANSLTKPQDLQESNDSPVNMLKANAIYRWVAENIHYDFESVDCEKTLARRKPQDAYFVFSEKTGVCEGYAKLLNLMMRMAGISCMNVSSVRGRQDSSSAHAFNAIYVEDQGDGQKGWTLLDSCWASPGGSDGDASIKKHLDGEIFYKNLNSENIKDILAVENAYTKAFGDALNKISSGVSKSSVQEFVDGVNKKFLEVLPKLKEQYANGPHFEKMEMSWVRGRGPYFKYKTDLTIEQASKAEDSLKKDQIYRTVDGAADALTGKLKMRWGDPSSLKAPLSIFGNANIYLEKDRPFLPHLRVVNNDFNFINHEIEKYYDELQSTYIDVTSISLDPNNIEEGIEKINEELNQKLEKINQNYSNMITIKEINLSLEEDNNKIWIFAALDIDITEKDIENLKENWLEGKKQEEVKSNGPRFEEFFPAFYSQGHSIDDANRSMVGHRSHKISVFDLFLSEPTEISDLRLDLKLNVARLDPKKCEGNAVIVFCDLLVEDSSAVIDYVDKLLEYGLPIEWRLSRSFYEKLELKGDCRIILPDGYGNTEIKEIDASKSSRYSLENGVLYEKTDSGEKKSIFEFYDGLYATRSHNLARKALENRKVS